MECKAPDLSDLDIPVTRNYILNLLFLGAGPKDRQASSFLHNYLRVTDKAIREYNVARELLSTYASSDNQTMLLLEAIDHFETCINSVKRSLNFADRMASHRRSPNIDRTLRKLFESYQSSIRPVRDAIEHIDSDIFGGGIPEGKAHSLFITQDGEYLEISNQRLALSDLAALLKRLHTLATELAEYQDEISSNEQ